MKKIGELYVSEFTVTTALWNGVSGSSNGYDLSKRGGDPENPVTLVSLYDCIKFTNALSEILRLNPVYYDNNGIVKSGEPLKFTRRGRGIHLPSAKEWDVAAAVEGTYLWGNEKYSNQNNPYAWCYNGKGGVIVRHPGLKKPNRYGLFDMCGNVCEWTDEKDEYGLFIQKEDSPHPECLYFPISSIISH